MFLRQRLRYRYAYGELNCLIDFFEHINIRYDILREEDVVVKLKEENSGD